MAATALIKFTQDTNVGADGQALLGELAVAVNLSNVDNTGVRSWQVEVVAVATDSAIPLGVLAFSNNSSTPSANFTPDTRGSYRLVLKVWDAIRMVGDPTSVDIRVFAVPEVNGFITPPPQVWPQPLPDPRSGDATAKPNELNFYGQSNGWAGEGAGDGLLNQLVKRVDAMSAFDPSTLVTPPDPDIAGSFEKLTAVGFHRPVATIYFQDAVWVLEAGDCRKQVRPSLTKMDLVTRRPSYSVSSPSDAEEWLNVAVDGSGMLWVVGDHLRGTQRFMRTIDFTTTPPTVGALQECGATPPADVSEYVSTPIPAPLSYDGSRMWTVVDGAAVGVGQYGVESSVWPSAGPWYIYADEVARVAALTTFVENDAGNVAFQSDNSTYWILEYSAPTFSWSSVPALGYSGARAARPRWVVCDTDTTHYVDAQPRIWLLSSSDDSNYSDITAVLDRFPVGGSVDATTKWLESTPCQLALVGSELVVLLDSVNLIHRVNLETLVELGAGLTGLMLYPQSFAYDTLGSRLMVLGYMSSCSGSRYAASIVPFPSLTAATTGMLPGTVVVSGEEPLLINALPLTDSTARGFFPTGAAGRSLSQLGISGAPGGELLFVQFYRKGFGYVPTAVDATTPLRTLYVQPASIGTISIELQDGSPMRPFSNLQSALDVVNKCLDTNVTAWKICLAPGTYQEQYMLAPAAKSIGGIWVTIEGVPGSTCHAVIDGLIIVPPAQGGECSYTLTNVYVNGDITIAANEAGRATTVTLELRDSCVTNVNADELNATDEMVLFVGGSLLTTDVDAYLTYYTCQLTGVACALANATVYMDGASIRGHINVLGPALLKNVVFEAGAVGVTADHMELVHTLFTQNSTPTTGKLTTIGGRAAPNIVMDRASYVSYARYAITASPESVLLSSDGGFPGGLYAPDPNTATAFDEVAAIGVHRAVATIYFQGKPWVLNAGDYSTKSRASLVRLDLITDTPDLVVSSPSDSEEWLNVTADSTGRLWVVGDDQRETQRFMRVIDFTTTPPTVGPKIVCGRTPYRRTYPLGTQLPLAAPLAYTGTRMWTTVQSQAVAVTVATMEVSVTITPSKGPDFLFANATERSASEATLTSSGLTAKQLDDNTYWESVWDELDYVYYWTPRSAGGTGLQGGSNAQPQWIAYDATTSNYGDAQPRLWLLSATYEKSSVSPYTMTPHAVVDRVLGTSVDATLFLTSNPAPHHLVVGGANIYVLAASGDSDQLLVVAPGTATVASSALTGAPTPLRAAYDATTSSLLVLCSSETSTYQTQVLNATTLALVETAMVPGLLDATLLEPAIPNVLPTVPSGWVPVGAASPASIFAVDLADATYYTHSRRGLGYVPPTDGGQSRKCTLYVDPYATGAQDGSAARPFSNLQLALDTINSNTNVDLVYWVIELAAGKHASVSGQLVLSPGWLGGSGYYTEFHVHFQGSGANLTSLSDHLYVTFPRYGRNCSVTLSDLETTQNLVLQDDIGYRTPALDSEHIVALNDASVGNILCTAMVAARLQIRIKGVAVATSLAGPDRFSTARVSQMTLSGIACHVYAEGAHILGACQVSGGLVLKDTDLNANANLTADTLTLLNSGHRASGTGVFNATGAAHSIEMDSASFAKVIEYGTRFNADAQLQAVGGGEFAYEFPKVETTTDTADQALFAQELQYWPSNIVVGVRVVVTAYNKGTVADYGYFERNALFDSRIVTSVPVTTLVKEGEVLFTAGPSVGTDSLHSIRFAVQGTSAALLCTPHSSTTDRNNSWKAVAYFSVHKAS